MSANQNSLIMIIDDEAPIRDVLSASLRDEGYRVEVAHDGMSGLAALEKHQPQVVLLDIWMPGKLDGLDVLNQARRQFPNVEFIIMSGHGTIETAVKATKLGAWDFVEKPLSMEKVLILLTNILAFQAERGEKNQLLNRLRQNIAIVGDSDPSKQLKQLLSRVAPIENWLLITGEPGVGRGLIAQNVHYLSSRASKPFVELNLGAVPESLVESELFGYERGAFTGAVSSKKGRVDLAFGGTLYIKDVDRLPIPCQLKLLRLLQDQKFERVGGQDLISANVRVLASTSKNLAEEVLIGKFRDDLFQRLNTVTLNVPPLKERLDDVAPLAVHFSEHFAREGGHKTKSFTDEAFNCLRKHTWPGQVLELRNFIERLYILTAAQQIEVEHLSLAGLQVDFEDGEEETMSAPSFKAARALFEREYIARKLKENQGNVSKTAESIGLERSHLHRKIKAYGIEVDLERAT